MLPGFRAKLFRDLMEPLSHCLLVAMAPRRILRGKARLSSKYSHLVHITSTANSDGSPLNQQPQKGPAPENLQQASLQVYYKRPIH